MSRRHFLLASSVAAFAQSPNDRAGTAVIGTGNRGSYLLTSVIEQPDTRVAAVCDLKADRLDKAASAAAKDNPFVTKEWRKVIERKDVDAVYVATPPHLHSEMAIAALEAGKHVYCEKPVGVNARQVRDIVRAAKRSNKVFVAGQQMRTMKAHMAAVEKIHAGIIGEVYLVKAQRHANADLPHDGSSGDWYFDASKSGGYLVEQSVHNLDLCNWAANMIPVRCAGFGSNMRYKGQPGGRTIFDNSNLIYEYPNGAKLNFTQNVFHPRQLPNGSQMVYVYGEKGAADIMTTSTVFFHDGRDREVLHNKPAEDRHAHTRMFFDLIKGTGKNAADWRVGATAALTAILGHEAMTKQRIVTWQELGVEL